MQTSVCTNCMTCRWVALLQNPGHNRRHPGNPWLVLPHFTPTNQTCSSILASYQHEGNGIWVEGLGSHQLGFVAWAKPCHALLLGQKSLLAYYHKKVSTWHSLLLREVRTPGD